MNIKRYTSPDSNQYSVLFSDAILNFGKSIKSSSNERSSSGLSKEQELEYNIELVNQEIN